MVGSAVRARRDHQGRRQADQRGLELDGAAPHADGRRVLRRRELRHVRPRLRPALRLHLAQPPHRGDGRHAARRRHVDRAAPRRNGPVDPYDEDDRRARARTAIEDDVEAQSDALYATGRVWDDGIIDPRDTRTVLGLALSAVHSHRSPGRPASRLPDVRRRWTACVLAAFNARKSHLEVRRDQHAARRQPGRDRAPGDPHRPDARHPHRRGLLRARTPTRRTCARPTVAVAPAAAARAPSPTSTPRRSSPRRARPGADAVHPGYGFLSENAEFAQACADAGLTWVGPAPGVDRGDGAQGRGQGAWPARPACRSLPDALLDSRRRRRLGRAPPSGVGFPLLVKASAGGGGKGMRARPGRGGAGRGRRAPPAREAALASATPTVFLERYLERARHVEIQVVRRRARQRRPPLRA